MSDPQKNPPEAPTTTPPADKKVKARVLAAVTIGDERYQPNDVISVDAKTLKAHADQLDADASAVKYAEGLKKKASSDAIED